MKAHSVVLIDRMMAFTLGEMVHNEDGFSFPAEVMSGQDIMAKVESIEIVGGNQVRIHFKAGPDGALRQDWVIGNEPFVVLEGPEFTEAPPAAVEEDTATEHMDPDAELSRRTQLAAADGKAPDVDETSAEVVGAPAEAPAF